MCTEPDCGEVEMIRPCERCEYLAVVASGPLCANRESYTEYVISED